MLTIYNQAQTLGSESITFDSNFEMYPNPANDYLNFNSTVRVNTIQIFDLSGREIVSKNVEGTSGNIQLNINGGVYVVQINSEDNVFFRKLLVK